MVESKRIRWIGFRERLMKRDHVRVRWHGREDLFTRVDIREEPTLRHECFFD